MNETTKQKEKYTTIRIKTATRERLRKEIHKDLSLGDDQRINIALDNQE